MADKLKRISSGVPGLDELIGGGFLEGGIVEITGGTGTGKTLFLIQVADECLKAGMKVLFMPMEETAEQVRSQAKGIGRWNEIEPVILPRKDLKYDMAPKKPAEVSELVKLIKDKRDKYRADIVLIDSLSSLGIIEDGPQQRAAIQAIFDMSRGAGCTTFVTSERVEGQSGYTRDTISEFLTDVLILLELTVLGGEERTIMVRKMRNTKIDATRHSIQITDKGIKVLK